jgi:hypothetical protein
MTVQARIIAALIMFIALTGGYFATYHVGKSDGYEQRDLEVKAENEALAVAALATQAKQSEQLIKAINVRTEKTKSNRADAALVDTERSRVRLTFAALGTGLQPTAATCTDNAAAERKLLDAIAVGVDHLAATAGRIAAEADGHAADSLSYQQGWPK